MRVIDLNLVNVVIIFLAWWLAHWVLTILAARYPNKVTVLLAS